MDDTPTLTLTLRLYTVAEREPPEGYPLEGRLLVWLADGYRGEAWWRGDHWHSHPVHAWRESHIDHEASPTDLWAEIPEVPHD